MFGLNNSDWSVIVPVLALIPNRPRHDQRHHEHKTGRQEQSATRNAEDVTGFDCGRKEKAGRGHEDDPAGEFKCMF